MRITSLDTVKTPTFVALGNFDGVHQGHRKVIEPILSPPLLSAAVQAQVTSDVVPGVDEPRTKGTCSHIYPSVVTFHPHPQEFFKGQRRAALTPILEKANYLQTLGVEQLVLLPFDQNLADLTPQQFVEVILVQQLQAKWISVGQDFCFGRQRSGTTADLQAIAAQFNIPVSIAPLYSYQGERISSSAIRQSLEQGNLEQANRLLGRPYALMGSVIQGQQLGRTLGFPTANLQLPPEKFLPRQGVYSVWVYRQALESGDRPIPGVMNLGNRPTVDGLRQTIEVHLLDWSGDLYGQELTVCLHSFLRPEQKFASLDALKAQIQLDCDVARSHLTVSQALS